MKLERKLSLLSTRATTAVNVGHISSKASYHNMSAPFYVSITPLSATFSVSLGCLRFCCQCSFRVGDKLLVDIQVHAHD